ncbi:MAG: hypothetical protein SXQ77_05390 [Halobacteria archaeon]|nr:hypothetical protein [Halobacteria archaeon]
MLAFVKASDNDRSRHIRLLLLGVFVAVVVGNVYFWGTLNILGSLEDPADGLISLYGPYYHFDALLPISAFMAFGAVSVYRHLSSKLDKHKHILVAVVVITGLIFTGVAVAEVNEKVEKSSEITEFYENAYRPFEQQEFENALVFLPTPMSDWLNHPFQYLRNSPELDGEVVYALDQGVENFDVVDAYPNRTYYRYSFRGEWNPDPDPDSDLNTFEPRLERVEVISGQTVNITTVVASRNVSTASVRLSSGGDSTYYYVSPNRTLDVRIRLNNQSAYLVSQPNSSVEFGQPRRDELVLTIHLTRGYLDEETYRQRFLVETQTHRNQTRVMSPKTTYCGVATGCQKGTAYIPRLSSSERGQEQKIQTEITPTHVRRRR